MVALGGFATAIAAVYDIHPLKMLHKSITLLSTSSANRYHEFAI